MSKNTRDSQADLHAEIRAACPTDADKLIEIEKDLAIWAKSEPIGLRLNFRYCPKPKYYFAEFLGQLSRISVRNKGKNDKDSGVFFSILYQGIESEREWANLNTYIRSLNQIEHVNMPQPAREQKKREFPLILLYPLAAREQLKAALLYFESTL